MDNCLYLSLFVDNNDLEQLDNVLAPQPPAGLPAEQQGYDVLFASDPAPPQEFLGYPPYEVVQEAPAQQEAESFSSTNVSEEDSQSSFDLDVETLYSEEPYPTESTGVEELHLSLGVFTAQTDSAGDLPFTALNSAEFTPVSSSTTRPPKAKSSKAKVPKTAPKHKKRRLKAGEKSIRYDKPVYIWLQGFARYHFSVLPTEDATPRTLKKFGVKRATSPKVESSGHFCLVKVEEAGDLTKVTWKINSGEETFYSAYCLEIYGVDECNNQTLYCPPEVYQIGSSGERKCYTREIGTTGLPGIL